MTRSLRSTSINPLRRYYGAVRPYPVHRYFRPRSCSPCKADDPIGHGQDAVTARRADGLAIGRGPCALADKFERLLVGILQTEQEARPVRPLWFKRSSIDARLISNINQRCFLGRPA